jgi:thousand and one amino acid protein kinase
MDKKEPVAIKKMNFAGKQSVDKWNDIVREVYFLRSISHPHIVRYKASFLKDQTCWYVFASICCTIYIYSRYIPVH